MKPTEIDKKIYKQNFKVYKKLKQAVKLLQQINFPFQILTPQFSPYLIYFHFASKKQQIEQLLSSFKNLKYQIDKGSPFAFIQIQNNENKIRVYEYLKKMDTKKFIQLLEYRCQQFLNVVKQDNQINRLIQKYFQFLYFQQNNKKIQLFIPIIKSYQNKKTQRQKNIRIKKSQFQQLLLQQATKLEKQKPTDVEKMFVYQVYNKIAENFNSTRYKPWPKIQTFLKNISNDSLVLDIGCGNGKYLNLNPNIFIIGIDRSQKLVQAAWNKNNQNQLISADCLYLPIKSSSFQYFINIAVVHHFSTKQLRLKAIKQCARILKTNGKGLVYVWAFEQQERQFAQQDVFVPWHLHQRYQSADINQQQISYFNALKNQQKKSTVFKRYYHVFKKGELQDLIVESGQLKIQDSYYDHANWCVVVKKK